MSTQLQLRRGTTAQHSTFTGASGEITIDTDKKTVVVHDGTTAGGRALPQFDSSGNLGLGVTPSAWTLFPAFQNTAGSFWGYRDPSGGQLYITQNVYYNSGFKYVESKAASIYQQIGGAHAWLTAPSGTAGNAITFTQAMTLDASGTLLIGRTSGVSGGARIAALSTGDTALQLTKEGVIAGRVMAVSAGLAFGVDGSEGTTERMRIDSSGRLLVGTSSSIAVSYRFQVANGQGGGYFECVASGDSAVLAKNTSGYGYIYAGVNSSGTLTYYVLPTGDVKNTNNSYGAISDQKLKENIVDASPKLDDLCKVKVRNFNFIGDELKQIGVIAQELEEVFPRMVDETPDYDEVTKTRTIDIPAVLDEEGNEVEPATTKEEEYTERVATGTTTKSVKYSVFVPMLIKAVQEQQAIIESLTQRIEALEYTKQGE